MEMIIRIGRRNDWVELVKHLRFNWKTKDYLEKENHIFNNEIFSGSKINPTEFGYVNMNENEKQNYNSEMLFYDIIQRPKRNWNQLQFY